MAMTLITRTHFGKQLIKKLLDGKKTEQEKSAIVETNVLKNYRKCRVLI